MNLQFVICFGTCNFDFYFTISIFYTVQGLNDLHWTKYDNARINTNALKNILMELVKITIIHLTLIKTKISRTNVLIRY